MSELQNLETGQAEETLLLAGYPKPKGLAKALDVPERTIARWHHFREGPPGVEIGRKVYYRKESDLRLLTNLRPPPLRAAREPPGEYQHLPKSGRCREFRIASIASK
jgi:hypothetical protein